MKKVVKALNLMLITVLLASCASTRSSGDSKGSKKSKKDAKADFETAYAARDYESCLAMLKEKDPKKITIDDNLNIAMLNFNLGNYEEAIKVFNDTDDMMYEALTKSITREIGAAVGNENATEYSGNVYESLLVNSINSLAYVKQGDLNNAVNQLSKLSDTKLPEYRRLYGEVDLNADELSEGETEGEDSNKGDFKKASDVFFGFTGIDLYSFVEGAPKKPTEDDLYKESALARYLSLVLRQADGDKSQIDSDSVVLGSLAKEFDISEDVEIPAGNGRLDVVALAGLIGTKTEGTTYFPSEVTCFNIPTGIGSVSGTKFTSFDLPVQFKFVFPKYEKTSSVSSVEVILDNGESKQAYVIENFNDNLEKAVNLEARKAYNRSLVRSSVKKIAATTAGIVAVQGAYEAYKEIESQGNPLLLKPATLAVEKAWDASRLGVEAIDLTETADLRQGKFFPETANATGFTVPAGTYTGKVVYHFANGITEEEAFEANVVEGKPTLVVSSCIK